MKKKILLISMLTLLLCGCGKVPKLSNGNDAVVSFEENEMISVDSLYEQLKDRYAVSILIDMIDKEILFKEYESKEDEADDYADQSITSLKQNYESDDELLAAIQSYYGYSTIKEFKEYIKLNYYRDLATTDYAKSKITDDEIEKYYEDEVVGDIEASRILITPDVTDDMSDEEKTKAEDAALEKAKEVIKKLDAKEDFSELAKEYSSDDATKSNGGALGKFNKDSFEKAFTDAAYKLKVNEYTKEPIKTSNGYQIILKTKEYDKASLEDSKDSIIEKLADEKISDDNTISITALTELRKNKGMKIEDSKLESDYNKYINTLYNYYNTSTTSAN